MYLVWANSCRVEHNLTAVAGVYAHLINFFGPLIWLRIVVDDTNSDVVAPAAIQGSAQ
jgi:hypothetical protein